MGRFLDFDSVSLGWNFQRPAIIILTSCSSDSLGP